MSYRHSRRLFLGATTGIVLAQSSARAEASIADSFPRQPEAMVREMVIVSHGNLPRVKELLALHPSLAKAAWDWGFGDWEDCLGAASHTGQREIAELLIANGARPSLFSAAMLGHLETVKAFVAAHPGVQRIPGPHGISLLAHAKNGGKPAEAVLAYLESLGDAGSPPAAPITDDEMKELTGIYTFGLSPSDRFEVSLAKSTLTLTRPGTFGRPLTHVGDRVFLPAGAPAVRIRFAAAEAAMTLTVEDPTPVVTARRAKA